MNLYLFIPLLFLLQGIYGYIGKRSAHQLQGEHDYFLAGKSISFFPLMMTFLATQVGGGVILGSADAAYQYGWWVLLYPLGICLGLIALGLGFGRKLSSFKVSTVAQILEIVYGSPFLKKIASLLSIISLFMILAAQFIASHKFLISVGLTNPFVFTFFWAIVILYTARGGLRAVISTDIAQATLFSIIFFVCFGFLLYQGTTPTFTFPSFAFSTSKLTGWLLMPCLYMIIEQDMGQRCFAGNSPKTVSKAAIVSGIATLTVCIVPVAFGIVAKNAGLIIPPGGSTLMTAIIYATNPWFTALIGCALLAAIISTATSLINAISSNLVQDFDLFRNKPNLRIARLITLAISIGAFCIAFYANDVVNILMQSYGLFVSAFFIPIVIALFKRRGYFLAALLSILSGMGGFILFQIVSLPFPSEIVNIALSLLGYGCGEWITRIQNKERKQLDSVT